MDWKKRIIQEYLFEGSIEARLEKFEIAWEIWKSFEDIKFTMRKGVLERVVQRIKDGNGPFSGYKHEDYGILERKTFGGIVIYKEAWVVNDQPILQYAIEHDTKDLRKLYYGIRKYDRAMPFPGNWEANETLPSEWREVLTARKKKAETIALGNWESSEWWVLGKYFDSYYGGMWQKEFYLEIIEKSKEGLEEGFEAVADFYITKFQMLIDSTENLVHEFTELYKKRKTSNNKQRQP